MFDGSKPPDVICQLEWSRQLRGSKARPIRVRLIKGNSTNPENDPEQGLRCIPANRRPHPVGFQHSRLGNVPIWTLMFP